MEITYNSLPEAVTHLSERLENIERLLTEQKEHPKGQDDLLTIDQAAEFLTLTKPTLYSKVSRRELPYMKRGKRLYFSKDELMAYLKEGRQGTTSELQQEAGSYLEQKRKNNHGLK
jgi:excisionase family DNA binding protein